MNKILFVEDGSVDVDEVKKILPEVPVIIYRQGALEPKFVEVDTTVVIPVKDDEAEPKDSTECFTADEIKYAVKKVFADKGSEWFNADSNKYYKQYGLNDDNIQSFADSIIEILLKSGVGPIENGSY